METWFYCCSELRRDSGECDQQLYPSPRRVLVNFHMQAYQKREHQAADEKIYRQILPRGKWEVGVFDCFISAEPGEESCRKFLYVYLKTAFCLFSISPVSYWIYVIEGPLLGWQLKMLGQQIYGQVPSREMLTTWFIVGVIWREKAEEMPVDSLGSREDCSQNLK